MLLIIKFPDNGYNEHGFGYVKDLYIIDICMHNKEEAVAHFGSFAHFTVMDVQASSEETRRTLGWQPVGTELVKDIENVYFNN